MTLRIPHRPITRITPTTKPSGGYGSGLFLPTSQPPLEEDEFRRSRTTYQKLETVKPHFTPELARQIDDAVACYARQTGKSLPVLWHIGGSHRQALSTGGQRLFSKSERLEAALWVFSRLQPAGSATEAMNQLACVLDRVESITNRPIQHSGRLEETDARPMRLPKPLPETVAGKRMLISHALRHVILFAENGAIQVQQVEQPLKRIDYQAQAQDQRLIDLNKAGKDGQALRL